jgi:hypothetical protein
MGYKSEVTETLFAVGLVCSGVIFGTYITEPKPPANPSPEELIAKGPKCYVLPWEVPAKARMYEEEQK